MINQLSNKREIQISGYTELIEKSDRTRDDLVSDFHYRILWTYALNCILGVWLVSSPFVFDYKCAQLVISDIVAGTILLLCECVSFSPKHSSMRWLSALIGVWLLLAPLVFWAPNAATYVNDTLIGILVIVFSIVVPRAPGETGINKDGADQPPGWTYNPSSWIRRWLGIALALAGFLISRYLAARQLGYYDHAWDPFFANGTDRVLHSTISKSLPVSDAGLGSVAYALEMISGFMGDRARWRTAPWVVAIFAFLVLPLGITSVALVMLQPTVVGSWCGLCLIAAVLLLTSVPLAVHELIAMGLFMLDAKTQRINLWKLFWNGGTISGGGQIDPDRRSYSSGQRWIASVQGVTVPWTILGQLLIGFWLMARPDVIPAGHTLANCDHLLGALIVTVAALATAEVTRAARLLNILLGLAVVAACVIFGREHPLALWTGIASGVALVALSVPRGEIVERYGAWNRFVK